MGKDRVLELLETADWNDIILKLTRYAIWRARRYTWRSGDPTRLPEGKAPEDIAIDAIEKVWNGTRDWDPEKYPDLLVHLKWIVKSDIEHLLSSMEHRKTGRMPALKGDEETEPDDDLAGRQALGTDRLSQQPQHDHDTGEAGAEDEDRRGEAEDGQEQ